MQTPEESRRGPHFKQSENARQGIKRNRSKHDPSIQHQVDIEQEMPNAHYCNKNSSPVPSSISKRSRAPCSCSKVFKTFVSRFWLSVFSGHCPSIFVHRR